MRVKPRGNQQSRTARLVIARSDCRDRHAHAPWRRRRQSVSISWPCRPVAATWNRVHAAPVETSYFHPKFWRTPTANAEVCNGSEGSLTRRIGVSVRMSSARPRRRFAVDILRYPCKKTKRQAHNIMRTLDRLHANSAKMVTTARTKEVCPI